MEVYIVEHVRYGESDGTVGVCSTEEAAHHLAERQMERGAHGAHIERWEVDGAHTGTFSRRSRDGEREDDAVWRRV
jgi:hypothetical protein